MDGLVVDAETRAAIAEVARENAALRQQIDDLTRRIDLYDLRGLNTLMFRNLFGASGGLYGTDKQAARVDHAH